MSFLLAGLIFAGASGAVVVGRWLSRRGQDEGRETETPRKRDSVHPKERVPDPRLEGFPCQLGDVLMRATGEEAWLAGAVVLSEDVPVAVLFVAPDVEECAIYVRPPPRACLLWLEPLDPSVLLTFGEPPTSVEHRGVRFERARRLPLRARRIGVGAPDFGDTAVVAEYSSAGAARLVVVKGEGGAAWAYQGIELDQAAYEVVAAGQSTLEP